MASLTKIVKTYAKTRPHSLWDAVGFMTDSEIGKVVNVADTAMGAKRRMSRHLTQLAGPAPVGPTQQVLF